MKLVTIKTFDNAPEAHIFRGRLESSGIQAFLFDENMLSIDPLMNVALGGIKLKVNEKSLKIAYDILQEVENTPLTNDDDQILICPQCSSSQLYSGFKSVKSFKGVASMMLSLLFSVYPLYFKNLYRCKECGKEFQST